MGASRESGQSDTFGHGKQLVDGCLSGPDRAAIRTRPSDDEQDVINPCVAALEGDPASLRLEIVDPGFRLGGQERGGWRR